MELIITEGAYQYVIMLFIFISLMTNQDEHCFFVCVFFLAILVVVSESFTHFSIGKRTLKLLFCMNVIFQEYVFSLILGCVFILSVLSLNEHKF